MTAGEATLVDELRTVANHYLSRHESRADVCLRAAAHIERLEQAARELEEAMDAEAESVSEGFASNE